ncbi:MAG: iron-containing alcohol dehydrogenase [Planctomycetes bacterium]|nr:iron-containing alcohol dehydrogenase [Planctomycetota bacterium]
MRTTWNFHSAGSLVFGADAVQQIGKLVADLGLRRVAVLTDRVLAKTGALDAVRRPLAAAGIEVRAFEDGAPEPSIELAETLAGQIRQFAPDGLLGLGGGSNMDLAKIVAVLLKHGGQVRDYVGECKVAGPVLPLICVPTTSGTGSEVTAGTVLTDTTNQVKVGVMSNYLRPRLAVVDPRLTLSCPKKVTADSGIDALVHAIEAYTAVDNAEFPLPQGEPSVYQGRNPLADCLAERAISLIGQHLATAVEQPANYAAREGMALAATLAGLAFSNVGVALVHAMEYPLGGATHCSHGEGNGLLLPFVMRFNLPVRVAQMARVAELLGENIRGLSTEAAAERAITAVEALRARIGIRTQMRELGVRAEQLPTFAEKAFLIKRILRVNPRAVTPREIEAIYRAAL